MGRISHTSDIMRSEIWGADVTTLVGVWVSVPVVHSLRTYAIPYYAYYKGYPLGYGVHVRIGIIMGMHTWGEYPPHRGVDDL